MKISYRPFSADEVWRIILDTYERYQENKTAYPPRLLWGFALQSQWLGQGLIDSDKTHLESLKPRFIKEIYNEQQLKKGIEYIESRLGPDFKIFANKFSAILKKQGIPILDSVEIVTTHGGCGFYGIFPDKGRIVIGIGQPQERILDSMAHEFIHILIELPIIQKYSVSQNIKEYMVDIIGEIYFDIEHQDCYDRSKLGFVHEYINKESVETDIVGAVKRMMNDYNKGKQNVDNENNKV